MVTTLLVCGRRRSHGGGSPTRSAASWSFSAQRPHLFGIVAGADSGSIMCRDIAGGEGGRATGMKWIEKASSFSSKEARVGGGRWAVT
jgi:hypothetical protein